MQTFAALIYAHSSHLQQNQITLFRCIYCCVDNTHTEVSCRHTLALNRQILLYLQPREFIAVKRAYYAKHSLHQKHTSPHGEISCRP